MERQTWIIPGAPGLTRNGDNWYIEAFQGMSKLPVPKEEAEKLARKIENYEEYIERERPASWAVWRRFWASRRNTTNSP